MEQQNSQSQQSLEQKIDKLQRSIDSLNKMFKWTLIITVFLFVVPLIGLLLVIPQFISTVTNYGGLLK
jgi:polyferredoxin